MVKGTSNPKGVVAAGHSETVKAAAEILRDGGNAFDAAVAAQLAAFAAEPVLTSPGGGGFLMAETSYGQQTLYDFFVQTPLEKRPPEELHFYPISADFGEATQEYHIGPGSVATPGIIRGLFAIHRDLCTLPMQRLAEPAISLAGNGVKMNPFQCGVFDIVKPIYRASDEARNIYSSKNERDELIREGETLRLPYLADLLGQLAREGDALFYEGEIAQSVSRMSRESGGHLTRKDFKQYEVVRRKPLKMYFRDHALSLNPPPGSGGVLIAFGLQMMEKLCLEPHTFGSAEYINMLGQVQNMTGKARIDSFSEAGNQGEDSVLKLLDPAILKMYTRQIRERISALRGTTQISIADSEGNLASLTSSNGEGSGLMVPGTDVMLNNMLGEQDLNPEGFHNWKPNERVTSMMAPGILTMNGDTKVAFGSGGSNRIRTAILQVLINLVDFGMNLQDAVNAPRIHCEAGRFNAENGFDVEEINGAAENYPNRKIWKEKTLFFGGAHSVCKSPGGFSGAGDIRRGGESEIVSG